MVVHIKTRFLWVRVPVQPNRNVAYKTAIGLPTFTFMTSEKEGS